MKNQVQIITNIMNILVSIFLICSCFLLHYIIAIKIHMALTSSMAKHDKADRNTGSRPEQSQWQSTPKQIGIQDQDHSNRVRVLSSAALAVPVKIPTTRRRHENSNYPNKNSRDRFIFCGSTCDPTTNMQHLAQALVEKKSIPLGKFLLGAVYQTLSQSTAKLLTRNPIGYVGPWWFLQLWLNLYTINVANRTPLYSSSFPSDHSDDEEPSTRRCISFGEAASTYPGSGPLVEASQEWFGQFYDGFAKSARVWFPYDNFTDYELPADLRLNDLNDTADPSSRENFVSAISPCILPTGVSQGRNVQVSYEFYHPTSTRRQLGLGQLPVSLYFARKIQTRGVVTLALQMDRILNIEGHILGSLNHVNIHLLRSQLFDKWWSEWKKHLFYLSVSFYLTTIIPSLSPQVPSMLPPAQSASDQPIVYAPALMPSGDLVSSIIGFAAPTVASLLEGQVSEPIPNVGGTRKPAVTKKLSKKPKIVSPKKPTDSNPPLDSDVEAFLDEAIMEEEVDKAVADISDTEDQFATDPKPSDVATPPRSPAKSNTQTPPRPRQHRTIRKVKPKTVSAMANVEIMGTIYPHSWPIRLI